MTTPFRRALLGLTLGLLPVLLTAAVPGPSGASEPGRALTCQGRVVTVDLALGQHPTDFSDVIRGTNGPDVIGAGYGRDFICARGGDDVVHAGLGNDRVLGGDGADILNLGSGWDEAWGERGPDVLRGQDGWDFLIGGPGDDRYAGGPGFDICGRDQTAADSGCDAFPGE